eukprot:scaffold259644_cov21-Tisochrysis_lutea.AAC.2
MLARNNGAEYVAYECATQLQVQPLVAADSYTVSTKSTGALEGLLVTKKIEAHGERGLRPGA